MLIGADGLLLGLMLFIWSSGKRNVIAELIIIHCSAFTIKWLSKSVVCVPGGADDNLIEGGEMKFVCKPGARNITAIFQPLLRYGRNVEHRCKRIAG